MMDNFLEQAAAAAAVPQSHSQPALHPIPSAASLAVYYNTAHVMRQM
jgi:hypothetical protein